MRATLKIIAGACAAGALCGCASNQSPTALKIVPTMQVKHSYETADAHYRLGRYFHGAQRWEEARKSYQQVLVLEPGHVKARNALAVLYAEHGDYEKAIPLLREQIQATPDAGHLFSNLGHTYYLNGEFELARISLEKAIALDPKNSRAWHNLGNVLEKLGGTERARTAFAQAKVAALGMPPLPAEQLAAAQAGDHSRRHAAAGSGQAVIASTVVKPVSANNPPHNAAPEEKFRSEIKLIGPGVYEVRRVGSTATVAATLSVTSTASQHPGTRAMPQPEARSVGAAASPKGAIRPPSPALVPRRPGQVDAKSSLVPVLMEVSNGNGIRGMARSIEQIVGSRDLQVVKLTNQQRFDVKATRIEYKDGYEQAARTLADRLGQDVPIVRSTTAFGSHLRLILGRDMPDASAVRAHYRKHLDMAGRGALNEG
ncbi:LytR C-terminal domain-containing protein [Noviherbaspirillum saxi]|nr:LytR C-terminal domain-containing protein [Noviherbaspirillum saxi]